MASPVDTSVKFFNSSMVGAPVLNGAAGSIIALLDACLVDGFGSRALTSLTVAAGVATATFGGGATAAQVGAVILVAGATPAELNGEQKVLSADATTVTFATAVANTTATGSITIKMASAGWLKAGSATNVAAYKSSDPLSTGMLLRVNDTLTTTATIRGFSAISDLATGVGVDPFPSTTQLATMSWTKSSTANATSNNWYLIGDGRMFYFGRAYRSGNNALPLDYELNAFGDFLSTKPNDPYGCLISGQMVSQVALQVVAASNYWYNANAGSDGLYAVRSYSALGGSVPMGKIGAALNGNLSGCSGTNTYGTPFPNPPDGGFYLSPTYLHEAQATSSLLHRGVSPGFYTTPHLILNGTFAPGSTVTGVTGMPGKTFQLWTCQNGSNGLVAFDITGPWR